MMYLRQLQVEGYQSFSNTGRLEFKKGFNLIIGQNNSGKSALLRAMTGDFDDDRHRTAEDWQIIRLPMPEVTYGIEVSVVEIQDWVMRSGQHTHFPIEPPVIDAPNLILGGYKSVTVEFTRSSRGSAVIAVNYPSHGKFAEFGSRSTIAIYTQNGQCNLAFTHSSDDGLPSLVGWAWQVDMFYFVAERMNIGESTPGYQSRLLPNAINLPNVLNVVQGERRSVFDRLVAHLREIFPTIGNLSVRPNPGNNNLQVLIWPIHVQENPEHAFPLNASGTGVSQVIAILAAVMTIDQTVIVIDEINSFLHPAAVKSLIRILQIYYPQHQYIISTHAPEVISSCDPSTIHMVQREGYESRVTPLDVASVNSFKEIADNLGISMSDVFAAEHVIWVEGPTEELCFPFIIKNSPGIPLPKGCIFSSVKSTGDFQRNRDRNLVFDIYHKLSEATALLPATTQFSFDSELLQAREKEDLVRNAGGRLSFLPRRHLECYLVDALAICEFLHEKDGTLVEVVNPELVAGKLHELGSSAQFKGDTWQDNLNHPTWLTDVDAAKLISQTVAELSNHSVTFNKKHDSLFLLKSILNRNPDQLKSLIDYVQSLIPHCTPTLTQTASGYRNAAEESL